MDEFCKHVVETVFADDKAETKILSQIKELIKLADKELYLRARDKKITIGQFKTRCIEKLNQNQFPFIDYDDVVHLIHPDCRNLDLKKVDKWALAAYGMNLAQLPLKGPDSFINKLENWQVQPRCLKSISNFSLGTNKRAGTADANSRTGKKKYERPSF